jgi:hypothetical protein
MGTFLTRTKGDIIKEVQHATKGDATKGREGLECTPKMRHEIKGPITLNGGEQCLCPDKSIPAN